jgi:hypothetical protein
MADQKRSSLIRILPGAALVVLGILALVYKGFSYTKETHEARIGGIGIKLEEKDRFAVPTWAGVGMIVAGGVLLAIGRR